MLNRIELPTGESVPNAESRPHHPGTGDAPTAFHVSHADGRAWSVAWEAPWLRVRHAAHDDLGYPAWRISHDPKGMPRLQWHAPCADASLNEIHLLIALEAAFHLFPGQPVLQVTGAPNQALDRLLSSGVIAPASNGYTVSRSAFWQLPTPWRAGHPTAYAQQYVMSEGRRHPLRPPKPHGSVYQRHIPWLKQAFSLRVIDIDHDLPAFSRWMNDTNVAQFWQEQGDLEKHRNYLQRIAGDPHTVGLIGCLDSVPFAYFEAYWAKEDRIAPYYDAQDYDRGWHVLIGEPHYRGRPFLTAWMPSIAHYLFLDDCRTQRLVIEPRSDNRKMIRSLNRCGYANIKEFQFPHKRAMLGMLLRERFFEEAIWIPQADDAATTREPTASPDQERKPSCRHTT